MKFKTGTCIAAIKTKHGKLLMAGDSRISDSNGFYFEAPVSKVQRKYQVPMLIGGCGDWDLMAALVYSFTPPKDEYDNPLDYMILRFSRGIESFLKVIPGYIDEHKLVRMAPDESCGLLVVYKKQLFTVDINSADEPNERSALVRISVNPVPFPFAVGSGSNFIYPSLLEEYKELGYNTEERLKSAMETTSKVDQYVDGKICIVRL